MMETLITQAQAYVQSTLSHRYNTIQVWRFKDAHPAFCALSTNGGDEDFVIYIPPALKDAYHPWLKKDVELQHVDLGDYGLIYVGSNA